MADFLANLPPVSPSLKSITPYLQRAEELKTQDPIIAYWCGYYAAQIGINLKPRDPASREFLFALLSALEKIKNEIGPNDAIYNELASSAYVENFALKVFASADNEDRNAHATRSTAKKFLAAANFLEILKTFPSESGSNEEKIRYAKWKAADIAKAFREGRKPAPGPPGWAEEQEELKRLQQELQEELQEQQQFPSPPTQSDFEFHLASESTVAPPTLSSYEAPHDELSSTGSNIEFSHQPASSLLSVDLGRPHLSWRDPETWSTVATSGVPDPPSLNSANLGSEEISSGNWSDIATELNGGENSSGAIEWNGEELPLRRPSEVDSPISSVDILAEPDDKIYFSPSTVSPQVPQPPQPPHFGSSTEHYGSLNTHTSPQSPVFSPSRTEIHKAFVQPSPPAIYSRSRAPPPPPVPVQEDPVELTPGIISKAQKHCRFAISALNYDDAEQARKELRAALTLLGG